MIPWSRSSRSAILPLTAGGSGGVGQDPQTGDVRLSGGAMPRYLSLFAYTGEAWARMIRAPGDRAEAAGKLIEELGRGR